MAASKLALSKKLYSLEDYYKLQDEISSPGLIVKGEDISNVEYNNGEISFMAGGTINHSVISANLNDHNWPAFNYNQMPTI